MKDRQKVGLLAGICLLVMALAAGFSFGFVYSELVIPGQEGQTLERIRDRLGLFRVGAIGWILILVLDVVVALALFRYFEGVQRTLSSITAGLRLVYSAFLGLAISYLFAAIGQVTDGADSGQVIALLESFEGVWSASLTLFGLHLVGLGVLSLRSDFVPRFWGWLLVFAGLCYTGVHGAKAMLPSMEEKVQQAEVILGLPMALGELGFAVWLIYAFFRSKRSAV